jgi:hypothetical protein
VLTPLTTRETVFSDTPASSATSRMVGLLTGRSGSISPSGIVVSPSRCVTESLRNCFCLLLDAYSHTESFSGRGNVVPTERGCHQPDSPDSPASICDQISREAEHHGQLSEGRDEGQMAPGEGPPRAHGRDRAVRGWRARGLQLVGLVKFVKHSGVERIRNRRGEWRASWRVADPQDPV